MNTILKLKGIKTLNKKQQSNISGGDGWSDICTAAQVSGSVFQYVLCPNWGDTSEQDKE